MNDLVKRYDVYPAYHSVDVEECHVGEFVYYADHADRIAAIRAIPAVTVQAQIDAAVKAERERWEAMSQIDFANQSTARSIRNIDALIRKGDQP